MNRELEKFQAHLKNLSDDALIAETRKWIVLSGIFRNSLAHREYEAINFENLDACLKESDIRCGVATTENSGVHPNSLYRKAYELEFRNFYHPSQVPLSLQSPKEQKAQETKHYL
jgi:hypothetical protein